MSGKIGRQAETQHGNGQFYHYIAELVDLFGCQELTLVDYNYVAIAMLFGVKIVQIFL